VLLGALSALFALTIAVPAVTIAVPAPRAPVARVSGCARVHAATRTHAAIAAALTPAGSHETRARFRASPSPAT
jgi:hypothetical protein